jgi:hypothetical protein
MPCISTQGLLDFWQCILICETGHEHVAFHGCSCEFVTRCITSHPDRPFHSVLSSIRSTIAYYEQFSLCSTKYLLHHGEYRGVDV